MGIVSVKETYIRTAETNEKFQRTYTRTFTVITDDPWTGPAVVREAVPIAIADTYDTGTEYDTGAYCLTKNATCTADDGKQWTVTANYGPPPENTAGDPLSKPWEIDWSFAPYERPADQDSNGAPIVNTVGDPFSTATMRDDSRPVLTIVRNEATFSPALAYLYRDTVNSDDFFGASPGQVKVSNISGKRDFDPIYGFFWAVTYAFTFDAAGYSKFILNQGFRELDTNTGKLKNVTVQGVPVSEPVLLSKKGQAMPPNSPPFYCQFDLYFQAAFQPFGLE